MDTKAHDDALDVQLRSDLNAMTSRLGDELKAEHMKVQETFSKIEFSTTAALEAFRTAACTTATSPGFQLPRVPGFAIAQHDRRTLDLAATIQSIVIELTNI